MQLALFDLDNTLLAGDSDFEWTQFLIDKGVLDRVAFEARNDEFYEQYKAGTLDIFEFLDFQLLSLAMNARADLEAWHAEFMRTRIMPLIGQKAREELIEILDRPVHLFLTVKVDPKWQDSKALYAQFGLEFDV